MTNKTTANRPSQKDQEWVRDSKGNRVRNLAYTGSVKTDRRQTGKASAASVMATGRDSREFDADAFTDKAAESAFVRSEMVSALTDELRSDQELAGWKFGGQASFGDDKTNGYRVYDKMEFVAESPDGHMMKLIDERSWNDQRTDGFRRSDVSVARTKQTIVSGPGGSMTTSVGKKYSDNSKTPEDENLVLPSGATGDDPAGRRRREGFNRVLDRYNTARQETKAQNPEAFDLE